MAPVVVCYHYPCIDGIFAAFAAHTSFMQKGISSRFVPLTVYKQHDISDLGLQGDETVYMLDYSGPDKFAVKLAAIAARVIVLDHHKTAAEQLSDTSGHPQNLEVLIDMNRSGATIALDYFKPSFPEELVKMFRYVEDGDLWRWQIPDSKAFYAGIKTLNLQCDANVNPDIFKTLQQLKPDEIVNKGRSVLGDVEALIKSAAQASYPMQLGGAAGASQGWGRCLSVEVERDMATHRSQLGNELAQRSQQLGMPPIGAVCYCEEGMEERGQIKVSLRSIGECDTTAVSQHFGGGGHKNASSFNVPLTDLHTWRC